MRSIWEGPVKGSVTGDKMVKPPLGRWNGLCRRGMRTASWPDHQAATVDGLFYTYFLLWYTGWFIFLRISTGLQITAKGVATSLLP